MYCAVINIAVEDDFIELFQKVESTGRDSHINSLQHFIVVNSNTELFNVQLFDPFEKRNLSHTELDKEFQRIYDGFINIHGRIEYVCINIFIKLENSLEVIDTIKNVITILNHFVHRKSARIQFFFFNQMRYPTVERTPAGIKCTFEEITNLVRELPNSPLTFITENYNKAGRFVGIDEQDLVRLIFEINLLTIFQYPTILSRLNDSLYSIGISSYYYDPGYLREFLYSRTFLHVMSQEKLMSEDSMDLKSIIQSSNKICMPWVDLFKVFINKYPNIQQAENFDFTQQCNSIYSSFQNEILNFLQDTSVGINFKKAVLANLLGEDDDLITGYNIPAGFHFQQRKIIDDSENIIAAYFIKSLLPADGVPEPNYQQIVQNREAYSNRKVALKRLFEELKGIEEKQSSLERKTIVKQGKDILTSDSSKFQSPSIIKATDQLDGVYEIGKKKIEKSVDFRKSFSELINESKDQNVNAIIAVYKYFFKKSLKEIEFSGQFLELAAEKFSGKKSPFSVFEVLNTAKQNGIAESKSYHAQEPNDPLVLSNAQQFILQKAYNINPAEDTVLSLLSEGIPIIVNLTVFPGFTELFNVHHGIVIHPSIAELEEGSDISHTFILCGYSLEQKMFIARSTWDNTFGDKGFCYIPFEYIFNDSLRHFLVALFEISGLEGNIDLILPEEKNQAIFNLNDERIKHPLIRSNILANEYNLASLVTEYISLRKEHENLMVKLRDPFFRTDLLDRQRKVINDQITSLEKESSRIEQEIKSQKDKIPFANAIFYTGIFLSLGLVPLVLILKLSNDFFTLELIAFSILGFGYFKKQGIARRISELEEQKKSNESQIQKLREELEYISFEGEVRGILLDEFPEFKKKVAITYKQFADLIMNLKQWYKGEEEKQFGDTGDGPFYSILENDKLKDYFAQNAGITEGIKLLENFNPDNNELDKKDIIEAFRLKIKSTLDKKLVDQLIMDFDIIKYLLKDSAYDYLSDPISIDKLFEKLQISGAYFLRKETPINDNNEYYYLNSPHDPTDRINIHIDNHFNPKPIYNDNLSANYIQYINIAAVKDLNSIQIFNQEKV